MSTGIFNMGGNPKYIVEEIKQTVYNGDENRDKYLGEQNINVSWGSFILTVKTCTLQIDAVLSSLIFLLL